MLYRLLHFVFAAYALGLIVYCIATLVKAKGFEKPLHWLGKLYLPVLMPLRGLIKPMRMGSSMIDLTPAVLLLGIVVVRAVVFYVLFGTP